MTGEPNKRLIKSYVWHEGKCFFVSTIDRDSSALGGPGRYAETMVWTFDWDNNTRGGEYLFSDGGGKGYIGKHLKLCQRIYDTGMCEEKEPQA